MSCPCSLLLKRFGYEQSDGGGSEVRNDVGLRRQLRPLARFEVLLWPWKLRMYLSKSQRVKESNSQRVKESPKESRESRNPITATYNIIYNTIYN